MAPRQRRRDWSGARQLAARGLVLRRISDVGLFDRGYRSADMVGPRLCVALPPDGWGGRLQRDHIRLCVRQGRGGFGLTEHMALPGLAITGKPRLWHSLFRLRPDGEALVGALRGTHVPDTT